MTSDFFWHTVEFNGWLGAECLCFTMLPTEQELYEIPTVSTHTLRLCVFFDATVSLRMNKNNQVFVRGHGVVFFLYDYP